jgi:spore coat protein U-like protein
MRRHIQKILQGIVVVMILLPDAKVMAAGGTLTVSATVLSNNTCIFLSVNSAINFGALNPANSTDVNASTTIRFFCWGSSPMVTFLISDNDGLYETGPNANRMRNTAIPTEYLPYSLTLNPTTATVPRFSLRTVTLTGTVRAVDYQSAYVGSYADTVIVTIAP